MRVTIEALRSSVEDFAYIETRSGLLDVQSANVILLVHDALKPENQKKFAALPVEDQLTIAWKAVK